MSAHWVGLAWFLVTVILYLACKKVYRRYRAVWCSPAIVVSIVLILLVVLLREPYPQYFQMTHWLSWMLGPATVAFALPIYQHRALMRKHWLCLAAGVVVGMPVAVMSSITLARWLHLSDLLQRSLAPRSISTPFALAATSGIGGSPQLTAVFVLLTGVFGLLFGETMLALLPLRSQLARGALLGAAAHGFGTAKALERDAEEGVVASLTMVIGGVATVFAAPLIAWYLG